jgi:O-methyltransferase involved in polyketide biosynthesis
VLRYLPEQSFRELLREAAGLASNGSVLAASISTSEEERPRDTSLDAIGEHVLTVPSRAVALAWVRDAGWTVEHVQDIADSASGTRPGRLLVRGARIT